MKIWKYKLEPVDYQSLSIPVASKVLCVQTQHETPMLWVLVYKESPVGTKTIRTLATGEPFDVDMDVANGYIGSYQLAEGRLVFHVFDS